MKCNWCKVTKLTSKNRKTLNMTDLDTKKNEVLLVCETCFKTIERVKADADKQAKEQGKPVISTFNLPNGGKVELEQ